MEPTEATDASTPSDDELVDRIRRDNDSQALRTLRTRYKGLFWHLAGANGVLLAELESAFLGCVMDYRGRGVFPDLVRTALKRRAIDFHRDEEKRGHVSPRDDDEASHRKLTEDGHPTVDEAPADDGGPTVGGDVIGDGTSTHDGDAAVAESSSAAVLRAAPPSKRATTHGWTDEDHEANAAFVDFAAGIPEGALREAARAARIKHAGGRGPITDSDADWHTESTEEKTTREAVCVDGIARAILRRPGYLDLLDAHSVSCADKEHVRQAEQEIERGLLKRPTSKLCPACRGIIKSAAVYCRHCRQRIDSRAGHNFETGATPTGTAAGLEPDVESAKRLLDKAATKRVKNTVERAARDRDEKFSIGGRRPPGPAKVRAFAEEAVRGSGKAPSLNALRVRKHRDKKRAAEKTGALPGKPPAR